MTEEKTPTIEDLAARVAALEARPKRVQWAEEDLLKRARALALMRRGYDTNSQTGELIGPYCKADREQTCAYLEKALLSDVDRLIDAAVLATLPEAKS
jgi:hypothetical protein